MRATLASILLLLWANVGVISGTVLHSVGNWTLHRSQIVCGGDRGDFCDYFFLLADFINYEDYTCSFQTPRVDPSHPDRMQFQNISCGQNNTFRVNGAWDADGNIVLCFTNVVRRLWAFFGYDRWELKDGRIGPDRESPVYPVGVFEKKRDVSTRKEETWDFNGYVSSSPTPCDWSVEWLNRYLGYTSMVIYFSFLDEHSYQRICTVNATAPTGTDPKYMSFYKLNCMENDWSVSWGYDPVSDAAVMTLLNPGCDRRTWFGWDNVNTRVHLRSAGPNPAEAYCSSS